jgi:fucose permease
MSLPLSVVGILGCGFLIGLLPPLVDALTVPLAQRLALSTRRAGQLAAVFYLAWLPGMPLAGWLADRVMGSQQLLFYGLLGVILGLAWLALVRRAWGCVGTFALLGFAYASVATAAVLAMARTLGFEKSTVSALNLGFLAVGCGAFSASWFCARIERWDFRQGLLALGLSLLLPAALIALSDASTFPARAVPGGTEGLLGHPQIGLIALVLLLYFVIENCLDVWPQPYLQELGHSARGVRIGLATFWGAFLLARLLVGLFGPTHSEVWLLLGLALCAAFALGNLVGAYGVNSGSVGFWVVGACYGPLLPGALALVPDLCPDQPGTALGALLALSGLDTLLVRPFLVRFAQRQPARAVMRVPTLLALILAAPLLLLALLRN